MTPKVPTYDSDDVVIAFDARRCIHAERCVRGLPSVFDIERRPWIDAGRAGADDIARVVEQCPSGALQYRRRDGGPSEAPPEPNTIRIEPNGPLYATGRLRITLPDGEVLEETRAALCRCGRSANKPFCDNAHQDVGFEDQGLVVESRLQSEGDAGEGTLEIAPARNGPVLVRGPLRIRPTRGDEAAGVRGALCRCGHSSSKPFCDGTHKHVGFEAP